MCTNKLGITSHTELFNCFIAELTVVSRLPPEKMAVQPAWNGHFHQF